ncbi:tetratricopeptide repeat protein [Campylobacter sp. FMV-PI01]|uniref:Tetratricopeptide repeat protein n=1 Tax=Campylobacter portucalensis TaxID=2608384 RepID=A0A6L5WKX0_9BACT|nr:tetratricopeptide repeat protein [Campylobacter portucalensis]MSN96645.1 tetratricopeptide repeat protein [Campylobacter portucalensis]
MKKIFIFIVAIFIATIKAEEVSVFGAGNLVSENPYGLTENEQVLLANKKRVDKIEAFLKEQNESIIGLRSVVEGLNSQISKLENRVSGLEIRAMRKDNKSANNSNLHSESKDIVFLKKEIKDLKKQILILNSELNSKNKTKVKQKSSAIDTLKNSSLEKNKTRAKSNDKIVAFDDMKPDDIMKKANELFDNKKYIDAKIRYEYLLSKGYKTAEVNFMLGEILYNQKSYAKAVSKYEKSIQQNYKANYLPRLLKHAGESLENLGDTKNSKKFFNTLKDNFPDSVEAKSLAN